MRKWLSLFFLLIAVSGFSFEKLPETYLVRIGDKEAKVEITEYLSLACPTCIDLFAKDFAHYRKSYLDTNRASWLFHLYPADLTTLQALVCLEQLDEEEKALFLEALILSLNQSKGKNGAQLMKAAMKALKKPISDLDSLEFLQKTKAFECAFAFLSQTDVPDLLPVLEIDGEILDAYLSRRFVQEQIEKRE